ncbi:MAG TPA: MEDS domain-containing protein [Acidimicrobiia bacterium]
MSLTTDPLLPAPHDHVVQFYGHDDELAENVGRYLSEGLEGGGTGIVIATVAHRRAFSDRLAGAGVDVDRARADGALVLLDAAEAMTALLVDGRLAPHRFEKVVGDVVREATDAGRPVRAYGEIVALLWGDGHVTAALELEALWNALILEAEFSLYCAYPLASVEGEGDVDAFHELCRQHSAVVGDPLVLPRLQGGPLELTRTYAPGLRGPGLARRFVTETLEAWGRPELVADAVVISSELVTNAVLHAGTDVALTISRRSDGAIRLAVRDENPAAPRGRRAAVSAGSGRGLSLVAAISSSWGADVVGGGKVVWAQFGR